MAKIYGKEAVGAGFVGAAWKLRLWYEITSPSAVSTQISYGLEIYNTTGEAYNNYAPPSSSAPYYKLGQGNVSDLEKIYFTYNYSNTATWHTLGTKTITITDPSVRSVVLSGAWHSVRTNWTPGDIETTVTIGDDVLPVLKTACTAPTSITVKGLTSNSTTTVIPSETIEISWTGAKGGVNNSITGYDVYINCTNNGTIPEEGQAGVFYTSTNKTSLNITNSSLALTRGYKIRVKIRTKGDDTNYYSEFRASNSIQINQLPSPPVAISKTVLSGITSTTISVSAGAMNSGFSRSTQNIYYSTSKDGNAKQEYNSATSFTLGNQGESKDFYFWTFDGKEFSNSYTIATITRNLAPAIVTGSTSFTGTKCIVYNFPSDKISINTFSGEITFNKKDLTCKPFIKYGDLSLYSQKDILSNITNVPFGVLTDKVFSFNGVDPRDYIPFGSTFTVGVIATDTMGESTSYEFKELDGLSLSVADFPKAIACYNGINDTNHFYNKVIFEYSYDSYFTDIERCFNCVVSNAVNKGVTVKVDGETKFKITVDVGGVLIPGTQYTFKHSLSKKNKTSVVVSDVFIRCQVLDGTTKNTIYLRPFTDGANNTTKTFDISLTRGIDKEDISEFFAYYDIDPNNVEVPWCKTYIIYNGKEVELNNNFTFTHSMEGDYFKRTVSFKGASLYELLEALNFPDKNTRYSLSIRNKIKNIFGREDVYDAAVLTVDYNEMPYGGVSFSGAPEVKILYNNNTYAYPKDTTGKYVPVTEGLEIIFSPEVKTYNFSNYTYTIQKSVDQTTWEDYIIENNSGSFVNQATFGRPQIISFVADKLKIKIGEISDSSDVYFRVGIKFEGYDMIMSNPTAAFPRLKHIKTPITLNEATYSENKLKINYQYNTIGFTSTNFIQSDSKIECVVNLGGVDNSVSLLNNSAYETWKNYTGNPQVITADFQMGNQTYGFLKLKFTSVSVTSYKLSDNIVLEKRIEKIYETDTTTIYNAAQTISYRKNHIGINTGKFEESDVIRINATADRHMAVFESSESKIYLDLQSGQLVGVVIDCGEITP